jgi:hypothetical protein
MCAYSAVLTDWDQKLPIVNHKYNDMSITTDWYTQPVFDFKKALEDLNRDVTIAKQADKDNSMENCVDPDKQRLEARVKELEKLLDSGVEFVIVEAGVLEAGTYRVIDKKLYKAFE